jgi:hypothetical protein
MLVPSTGCWVMDELDQGADLMAQHSTSKIESDTPDESRESPDVLDQALDAATEVKTWWAQVRAPAPSSDPIIECHLKAKRSFTTESDCLARGGWVRP